MLCSLRVNVCFGQENKAGNGRRAICNGLGTACCSYHLSVIQRTLLRFFGFFAQNLIGAAFNLKMLTSDFGGYAHNQQYTMSLIFDTIDYLQHGSVTGVLDVSDPVLGPQIQFIFGASPVRPI